VLVAFPPKFFLIGAQKAGTTTLAHLLDRHPEVVVSQPKEPHFFTYYWDEGLGWYRRKFPDLRADTIAVDASTTYSMAPLQSRTDRLDRESAVFENVPGRIHSVSPEAKFIYLLRDPVERTYSGYWHNVRTGRENRSFREALRENPFYLEVSDYYGQLTLWLEYFSLDSFCFVLFEDLVESPAWVASKCFTFFGVDSQMGLIRTGPTKDGSHAPVWLGRAYDTTWLGRKTNRAFAKHPDFSYRLLTSMDLVIPSGIKKRVKNLLIKTKPVPEMKADDRDFLNDYFRERNQRLENEIGLSLDRWQR
jgi:hypothetical protein